jgi:hypothetical protein
VSNHCDVLHTVPHNLQECPDFDENSQAFPLYGTLRDILDVRRYVSLSTARYATSEMFAVTFPNHRALRDIRDVRRYVSLSIRSLRDISFNIRRYISTILTFLLRTEVDIFI